MCKASKTPAEETKEEWEKLRAIESPIAINTVDEISDVIDISKCPKNERVAIYDKHGKLIVRTNEDLIFEWVRAEIVTNRIEGCYVIFRDQRYDIDNIGKITPIWPNGLFDEMLQQSSRCLQAQVEEYRKKMEEKTNA